MLHELLILVAFYICADGQTAEAPGLPSNFEPAIFGYHLVAQYPHDTGAFTEGLIYERGCSVDEPCQPVFWESTGSQYYTSTVRKVNLTSGQVLKEHNLPAQDWGEGLTLLNDTLYQLTWQNPVIWRYPKEDISGGAYATPVALPEGWGLTTNGSHLIASDGSNALHFLDPDSLEVLHTVQVTDGGQAVSRLNELEYVSGLVWANIWTTECIAIIEPDLGAVIGWLQLADFKESLQQEFPNQSPPMDVVNGIAYDGNVSVYLTGKDFPRMWEIQLAESPANADLASTRQACRPSS